MRKGIAPAMGAGGLQPVRALPPALDRNLTEMRARIIWGTPPAEVREWLLSQGAPPADVDRAIALCLEERAAEIRRIGLRDTLIGAGLIAQFPVVLIAMLAIGRIYVEPLGASIVAGCAGAWRLLTGLERFLRAGKIGGSVSDLSPD